MALYGIGASRRGLVGVAVLAAAAPPSDMSPKPPTARLPPLPPAVIEQALAIGGKEIGAARVSTRMSLAVRVDGSGPFAFVVDSGAYTFALSTRAPRDLGFGTDAVVTLHL